MTKLMSTLRIQNERIRVFRQWLKFLATIIGVIVLVQIFTRK